MSLLRRRQKDGIDRRKSLAGVPMLHDNVTIEDRGGEKATLKLRTERGPGFFERFKPAVSTRKYELDEFGTFVVREIQKKKNVLEIIRAFEQRFGMSHRESELGVVAFIRILLKREVLLVVIDEKKA